VQTSQLRRNEEARTHVFPSERPSQVCLQFVIAIITEKVASYSSHLGHIITSSFCDIMDKLINQNDKMHWLIMLIDITYTILRTFYFVFTR